MKQENIKFIVDQLRKDKIIYATEACATVLMCILGFLFANMYLEAPLNNWISALLLFIGVGYTIFMGVGNFIRLQRIKKLEKGL